jgi:hypothetical protein
MLKDNFMEFMKESQEKNLTDNPPLSLFSWAKFPGIIFSTFFSTCRFYPLPPVSSSFSLVGKQHAIKILQLSVHAPSTDAPLTLPNSSWFNRETVFFLSDNFFVSLLFFMVGTPSFLLYHKKVPARKFLKKQNDSSKSGKNVI